MKRHPMMAGKALNDLVDKEVFRRSPTGNDYSGKIEHAWMIVDRLEPIPFSLFRSRSGWFANFEFVRWDATLEAETAMLAICYAGLKQAFILDYGSRDGVVQKAEEYMESLFGYKLTGGGY